MVSNYEIDQGVEEESDECRSCHIAMNGRIGAIPSSWYIIQFYTERRSGHDCSAGKPQGREHCVHLSIARIQCSDTLQEEEGGADHCEEAHEPDTDSHSIAIGQGTG